MRVTRLYTSGSVPEPMWLCSRVILTSKRSAMAFTSPRCSCQMPKLDAGPPVLVRLVEPLPSPGFIRTETDCPWRGAAEGLELVERARIEEHAAGQVLGEPARGHLGRELDRAGREAGAQRALDLVVARGVDVEAEAAEQLQDTAARVGLHRVAHGEPEGRGEGEGPPRGRLEGAADVDIARRGEAVADLGRVLDGQRGLAGHRSATSTACPEAALLVTASVNSM